MLHFKCKLTPKEVAAKLPPFWCKLTLTFLRKQLEANISPVITFLLFFGVVINTMELNISFNQFKVYTKISGIIAATKRVEKLHLLTVFLSHMRESNV